MQRLAMLDDVLQGFLQDAVKTEGEFPWQRFRDVLDVDVNRQTPCRLDNSSQNAAAARSSPRSSSLAG